MFDFFDQIYPKRVFPVKNEKKTKTKKSFWFSFLFLSFSFHFIFVFVFIFVFIFVFVFLLFFFWFLFFKFYYGTSRPPYRLKHTWCVCRVYCWFLPQSFAKYFTPIQYFQGSDWFSTLHLVHIIWFCYHLSSESTHWQDWQKCQQIIFGQNATWWLLCKNFTFLFYFIGVLYLTTGKFCVGWFFWENVTEKNLPIVFMREVIHENLVTHVVEYLFIYLIYLLINLSCFLFICLVFFSLKYMIGFLMKVTPRNEELLGCKKS